MDSVIAPAGKEVKLGNAQYLVKPVKFNRVYKLKRLIIKIIQDLDGVSVMALLGVAGGAPADTPEESKKRSADAVAALDALLETIMQRVGKLFTVAIPKLDAAIFSEDADDEVSPDVAELWDAFLVVLEVNHLEFIKNQIAAFTESLRSGAPRQNGTLTTMPSPPSVSSTDSLQAQLDNLPFPN